MRNLQEDSSTKRVVAQEERYEILDSLPTYGAMYIPVSENGKPFHSEGFSMRFFKNDGTSWVANFQLGWTGLNKVYDYPKHDIVVVVAGGLGYIMKVDCEKPLSTFGMAIREVFQTDNGCLVCVDVVSVIVYDVSLGEQWHSERISWDGFQNIVFKDNTITGQSYDPTNSIKQWCDFSLNIETKELIGGSYRESSTRNPDMPKIALQDENQIKPWWKLW